MTRLRLLLFLENMRRREHTADLASVSTLWATLKSHTYSVSSTPRKPMRAPCTGVCANLGVQIRRSSRRVGLTLRGLQNGTHQWAGRVQPCFNSNLRNPSLGATAAFEYPARLNDFAAAT